jgi:response regulator RpfG family c-di-GMP phosphodiesterase
MLGKGEITILAVDDDPEDLLILNQTTYRKSKYHINSIERHNRQGAGEALNKHSDIDLIISDLFVDSKDVKQELDWIKETLGKHNIPTILLTAYVTQEAIVAAYENNCNIIAVAEKPLPPEQLDSIIDTLAIQQ